MNFSREEVEAAIQANIKKKGPGHDEIGASFIKNSIIMHLFLQTLFNTCLRLGETPLTWGKAICKPIPITRVPSKKPSEY